MLKPSSLGAAGGIIWAVSLFVMTVISMYTGYGELFLQVMKSVYIGYTLTWGGAFLGLVYGFIDGFIGLWVLAWLYNRFSAKASKKRG